ncbi:ribosomal protein L35 [Leptospira interrogans str. 2003000735]|uniref:Large ribosomal subunit protein bL35 n=13 Tax=Leptospira TaxID=171 RepID=M3IDG3_LEPIR|nr:ribosomal protein L35 [Leptospira interrogans serovar Lora str. TE 1992]EMF71389.1 ribosomal protein L35 [Leptospira interrogans serovar Canicola str. LT1962]EMG13371.1 ribosomal protein L35 [Leptospira interrogans serovar Grippotyphosa str. LT2186]EMG20355.1 ribosomal protein L35 [Leptospira interrogans serovar Copenhageni str. LT2050]EMI61859.1 ribosomal protein L35 [Leptospira noguchii str. Bonito]EMJ34792.1 ribosomal protein L35 [Leptospira interrogans str. FPW1039]EMJ62596.1 ribosomal
MKTNRAAAKRFKFTKNNKIKRKSMNTRHILTKKGPKRRRRLRGLTLVHNSDWKSIVRLMPYGVR